MQALHAIEWWRLSKFICKLYPYLLGNLTCATIAVNGRHFCWQGLTCSVLQELKMIWKPKLPIHCSYSSVNRTALKTDLFFCVLEMEDCYEIDLLSDINKRFTVGTLKYLFVFVFSNRKKTWKELVSQI